MNTEELAAQLKLKPDSIRKRHQKTGAYFCLRPVKIAYSTQTGHLFRRKLDSHSSANWTPVPCQTGHLFHVKLDTLGVTARG